MCSGFQQKEEGHKGKTLSDLDVESLSVRWGHLAAMKRALQSHNCNIGI